MAGWLLKKKLVLFSIFSALVILKQLMFAVGFEAPIVLMAVSLIVIFYSIAFLVFYIISERIIQKMIPGMICSIIGSILAFFFPPLGIIIAIIGIFSMISQIISVVKMIPLLLLGILVAILLFSDIICLLCSEVGLLSSTSVLFKEIIIPVFGFTIVFPKIMLGYFAVSALASLNLAFKYSLKNAMLRQVVIFMAIPITALIIFLVKSALERALYNPGEMQQAQMHNGKVFVHGYTRANGTFVRGFWRNLPKI